MKASWLVIGGPAVVVLGAWFLVASGIVYFGDVPPGIEHQAGVESGGTFAVERQETYQCDEGGNNCVLVDSRTDIEAIDRTSFAEIEGLDMEIEQDPIEYREGDEITTVRKLSGLNKYANINMRIPTGVDWGNWKFTFEPGPEQYYIESDDTADPRVEIQEEASLEFADDVEMIQIEPPRLVIPAN